MLLLHMFHPGSNTYVQIYQEKQKRSSIFFFFLKEQIFTSYDNILQHSNF